ncbi:hypothetical protein CEP54_013395 [Fusarium duplospermum]|uniref:Aminotransferase class I/classII large domain-containing protein n=1 Tax=Fusarium duplospermum TaxID=1325734 RepID=A0A428P3A4_9HYPO|nr:hypothetical protein CEP54_013395 [Fusarium duplospermum]
MWDNADLSVEQLGEICTNIAGCKDYFKRYARNWNWKDQRLAEKRKKDIYDAGDRGYWPKGGLDDFSGITHIRDRKREQLIQKWKKATGNREDEDPLDWSSRMFPYCGPGLSPSSSLACLDKDQVFVCHIVVGKILGQNAFGEKLPVAASLGDHVLSVSSLSKSFGIPGVRIGWLISTNKKLQETFLAAKEQISISGSVINEWIATQVLSRRQQILADTTDEMRVRLQIVESWIESEELLEWVKPTGGVVCFPRIKEEPKGGYAAFYDRLLTKHATYVGPGHWFELPDYFFRLGYGWPTREELEGGLKAISEALRDE